jgi:hypothetical protein
MTHIERMLRDGVSAEDLVKEISEAKRKIDAETAEKEKNQKKIADSRKDFVTAAINYVSALGIDMGSEDNIKSIIKVLEDSCESYEKHLTATPSDDEMFADFFNTLFS